MGPGDKGRGGERKQEKLGELISPDIIFHPRSFCRIFREKSESEKSFPTFCINGVLKREKWLQYTLLLSQKAIKNSPLDQSDQASSPRPGFKFNCSPSASSPLSLTF